MMMKLWNDELGAIVSAEIVLIATILVLSMIVGLHKVSCSINQELADIANSFGSIDQSYMYKGQRSACNSKCKAVVAGSCFTDYADECDIN